MTPVLIARLAPVFERQRTRLVRIHRAGIGERERVRAEQLGAINRVGQVHQLKGAGNAEDLIVGVVGQMDRAGALQCDGRAADSQICGIAGRIQADRTVVDDRPEQRQLLTVEHLDGAGVGHRVQAKTIQHATRARCLDHATAAGCYCAAGYVALQHHHRTGANRLDRATDIVHRTDDIQVTAVDRKSTRLNSSHRR